MTVMMDSFLLKLATPTIGPPLPGIWPNVEEPKPLLLPDDPEDPKLLPPEAPKLLPLDEPNELPLLLPKALCDDPVALEPSLELVAAAPLLVLPPFAEASVAAAAVSQFVELLLPPNIDDPDPIVELPPLCPVTAAPPNEELLPPSWLAEDPGDPPNALALVLQFGFVFPPVPVCP